jgi:2'-hydroxyisoflavone reductase
LFWATIAGFRSRNEGFSDMRILILGGTFFVGRHLVDAAQARGHELVLFNRGKSGPNLFPDIETLHGDRNTDEGLSALDGAGDFDAVIDTCGYFPRVVQLSLQKMAPRAKRYCFISTISVYQNWPDEPCPEDADLLTLEDPAVHEMTGVRSYGALKVLCEQEAEAAFPGKALIIRCGLIVGPHDWAERVTYWAHRAAQGGEVLAPGGPELQTQWIDVRDLSEWTIRMLEEGKAGIFNANGPRTSFGVLLDACGAEKITYVPEAFLQEQGVEPWDELPLWRGVGSVNAANDCRKAIAAGLIYRPLTETVRDTLAWDANRPQEKAWKNTLKPEKEAMVLRAWHKASMQH